MTIPERIELDAVGAAVRRYRSDDVDRLHEAIEASRDHLRPFMPWADQDRAATEQFVRTSIGEWAAGTNQHFVIVDGDLVLGGCGLHSLGPGAREIGYWRRVDAGGRGVVTAAAMALTDAAFLDPTIERVAIECDEANTASAAVPRRLGFELARVYDRERDAPGTTGRHMEWTVSRDGWFATSRRTGRQDRPSPPRPTRPPAAGSG